MDNIYLFGASGHGKVIKEVFDSQNIKITAFVDDFPKKTKILNIPIILSSDIKSETDKKILISIGDNKIRKEISKKLKSNFITAIHKKAIVSNSVKIDKGTVVMAGAVINSKANIGKHCVINSNAVVEHDCVINDFVHVSPNATVTGGVEVGEGTHIGAGAIVIPNIKIGKWVIIGAGTVVIRDVPDYAVVVGNPGKIIKYTDEQ